MRSLALVFVAALALAAPLSAQVNVDSLRLDSLRVDSLRTDSLRRRQSEQTTRFLEEAEKHSVILPALSLLQAEGPRTTGARIVFDRDSLDWAMAETVGDLVARVPGVYLWRSGYTGALEQPNYRGMGPTAVEYVLDGIPYIALGPDSVAVDATVIGLSLLERVEIDTWPGLLRVRMYTRRYERLAPRSRIGLARGDNDLARYQGTLEKRAQRGISFGLGGDYYNSGSTSFAAGDFYRSTMLWMQAAYIPKPTLAFQAQYIRTNPRRLPTPGATGTAVEGIEGARADLQLRAQLGSREQEAGRGLDLIAQRTTWGGDGPEQEMWQLGAMGRLRTPSLGLGLSAFYRSFWTPLDAAGRVGWVASSRLSVDAEGVYRAHSEGRASAWVGGRAALGIAGPLSLRASGRVGTVVAAPALDTSSSQSITEFEGTGHLSFKWADAFGGVAHTSRFSPPSFPAYLAVPGFAENAATNWVTAGGSLRPFNWMAIEGWYSHPLGSTLPDGQPPQHLRINGSIRSKFLRHFKSGAFELKGELGFERWGEGVIGRTATGVPIVQPTASYLRGRAQLRLQSFMIYFERANITGETVGYVPGLTIPTLATTFGFRWEFIN